jgi:hypothetical protein
VIGLLEVVLYGSVRREDWESIAIIIKVSFNIRLKFVIFATKRTCRSLAQFDLSFAYRGGKIETSTFINTV